MSALALRSTRRPARIGLTPLIDVVFILMIFFMLASTFAHERQIDLDARRTAGGAVDAAVRLLVVGPDSLTLDGAAVTEAAAQAALAEDTSATVAVKPAAGASVQRVIDMADVARAAGVADVRLAR